MKIDLSLKFAMENDTYQANLTIPQELTETNKFQFYVIQNPGENETKILSVEVANADDYSILVEPPKSIFELAGIGDVVKDLKVEVSETPPTE